MITSASMKMWRVAFDENSPSWKNISKEGKELVKNLLAVDPSKRLSIHDISNHAWFKKVRSTSINPLETFENGDSQDVLTYDQRKGFKLENVFNGKLAQRRRQKNSNSPSVTDEESATSELGRSKSSSGIVTSDPNNRSISIGTSNSDNEVNGNQISKKFKREQSNNCIVISDDSKDGKSVNDNNKFEYSGCGVNIE